MPKLTRMSSEGSKKCVLIVDDHLAVRKALRSLLENSGYEVCGEAGNGKDGVEKAKELLPDLILLDFSMPVMNGLEAARELQELMPNMPILMVTNHVGAIPEEQVRKAGIRAVIAKSDAPTRLIESACALLAVRDGNALDRASCASDD